ncbi:MAG: hypothetical protein ACUZ77_05175 [Candidatus Brocadiales bacterium]
MKRRNTNPFKDRMLIANPDIANLHSKPEGTVTEEDLKTVLRRYNLREGLITLGRESNLIFSGRHPKNMVRFAYQEPQTGITITQSALAYLANLLLISGANDYRSRSIGDKNNLLALCNIYNNCLVQPESSQNFEKMDKGDKFLSVMVRLNSEQITCQFNRVHLIAGTLVLFKELINKVVPSKFDNLSVIFEQETGLTIYVYFRLAIHTFVGSQDTATFRMQVFTEAKIPKMEDILTEEKANKFLAILKTDYRAFRNKDRELNKNLNPIFTKTRFNPLNIFPIIETDPKHFGNPFVIPNFSCYFKKAFGGLYWWFHHYFEAKGQQQDFRNYFGYVFQEYVGLILKNIYGEQNVRSEVTYNKDKKFIDWWIERGEKIYLFEVKAYQFALMSLQTGDKELIVNNEIKKIADAIEQVYRRVKDIPKYQELYLFKGKKLIPVIVFMDMPLISIRAIYEKFIKEALEKRDSEKKLDGLKKFQFFLMNIEELELYDDAVDKIELEEVFLEVEKDNREDFFSVVKKVKGSNLRNRFLDETYKKFWEEIVTPKNE